MPQSSVPLSQWPKFLSINHQLSPLRLKISQPSNTDINIKDYIFTKNSLTHLTRQPCRRPSKENNTEEKIAKSRIPSSANLNKKILITCKVNDDFNENCASGLTLSPSGASDSLNPLNKSNNSEPESQIPDVLILKFNESKNPNCYQKFVNFLERSNFISRTEENSAQQYFQFYSLLSQQQNMMQDYVRTGTYQQAMLQNSHLFKDKVVMDCGAGSAILSFFAIQAGAKKVFAVEASNIAKYAAKLVDSSPYKNRIEVIPGKLEEVSIPANHPDCPDRLVDILISEPMGYMLYNERMLESYVHAKKFLKPDSGMMFPSLGDTFCAPFSNEALYLEQHNKASFWCVNSFYGINLTHLHNDATNEYFSQPVVDQLAQDTLLCPAIKHRMDFRTATETDFKVIEIPFNFTLNSSNMVHGLAFWFDVCFAGTSHGGKDIWLSTAPTEPLTHWYQVGCVFKNPLFGRAHEHLVGKVTMTANIRQSYDILIEAEILETGVSTKQEYDLKNPFFRYTGQAQAVTQPGHYEESPSNLLWNGVTIGQNTNVNATQVGQLQNALGVQGQDVTGQFQSSEIVKDVNEVNGDTLNVCNQEPVL